MAMQLSGWGRYPRRDAQVEAPVSLDEWRRWLSAGAGAVRGMGRSYGDSALAARLASTRQLDCFESFDAEHGRLTCQSGVTLREILELTVPRGWTLPVSPGTSWVTVGGAIASDVHGKNHHHAGSFCDHVDSITLLCGDGSVRSVSRSVEPELFSATCGGMGLTGVVLSARFRLQRVHSAEILETKLRAGSWEESCELFDRHADQPSSVAWVDVLARGRSFGRSIFSYGRHAPEGSSEFKIQSRLTVPAEMPTSLLNSFSMRAFNRLYYSSTRECREGRVPMSQFFYPLDSITHWNRLYGSSGFVQYQFVVPVERGVALCRRILETLASRGHHAFLAVLKLFGKGSGFPLSFPTEGYTLALDFRYSPTLIGALHELDRMILDGGGRVYLTKDSCLQQETFRQMYPRWEDVELIRRRVGSQGIFLSDQAIRLGFR
jgi:FAD/FMN-containing dehydrogenase